MWEWLLRNSGRLCLFCWAEGGIGLAMLVATTHREPFPFRSPLGPCQKQDSNGAAVAGHLWYFIYILPRNPRIYVRIILAPHLWENIGGITVFAEWVVIEKTFSYTTHSTKKATEKWWLLFFVFIIFFLYICIPSHCWDRYKLCQEWQSGRLWRFWKPLIFTDPRVRIPPPPLKTFLMYIPRHQGGGFGFIQPINLKSGMV